MDETKKNIREPSVAISYDTRNNSEQFAKEAARILALEGCIAYIYPVPTPTPMLSFAVRELKCHLGICITASHNPKEYNGYKIYDETGCQSVPKEAAKVVAEINKITDYFDIDHSKNHELIQYVGKDVDDVYINFKEIIANYHK